jgi:ribosomal protein S18 acetylase RimI-like enzyme
MKKSPDSKTNGAMFGPAGRCRIAEHKMVTITRAYIGENMGEFSSIEFNWSDIGEIPWDESNFLLELPRKWDLSFAVEHEAHIIAYIIGSQWNTNVARVNKIVVDRGHRRESLGRQLMERFEQVCRDEGIYMVELKALADNPSANSFYRNLGYQPTGSIKGTDGSMRNVYLKSLK